MITTALQKRLNSTLTELVKTPSTRLRSPTPPRVQSPALPALPTRRLSNETATLSTNPRPNAHKEIATVAKIYTEEQKYGGVNDSFDYKLTIFYDICKRSGISSEEYMTAFPTMLKGYAQDHYYSSSLSSKPFVDACTHMRNFFEGAEYYRKNLTEWNAISL